MKDEILIEMSKALDYIPMEDGLGKIKGMYDDMEYADSKLWEKVPNCEAHTGKGYNPLAI